MAKVTRKEKFYDELITETIKSEVTKEIKEVSSAKVKTNGPETINGTVVNCLSVNVRKWPSFESNVIEILTKGDKVKILGKEKGFYKVSTKNTKVAYISSDFIKED